MFKKYSFTYYVQRTMGLTCVLLVGCWIINNFTNTFTESKSQTFKVWPYFHSVLFLSLIQTVNSILFLVSILMTSGRQRAGKQFCNWWNIKLNITVMRRWQRKAPDLHGHVGQSCSKPQWPWNYCRLSAAETNLASLEQPTMY